MIKVLNILTDSNIGGAGRYLINYLKAGDRERFSVTVVLPAGSLLIPEIKELQVPVIEAEGIADRSFSGASVNTLRRIIRREKPDIVHTHGSLSGRIAAKLCGVKIVYTRHCAFPVPEYLKKGPCHRINGGLNSLLADQIMAVSPAAAENLTDSGLPARKITVMMNGGEALRRSSPETCAETRAGLGIPDGVFTAGILARLETYKGHEILLEAARELKAQGRDFRILIGGNGTEEENIRQQIARLGLSRYVLFLGFVQDVAAVLSILDVQLNCSFGTETSSLSLIEGMSMGIPAVASDYGGNPWLIDDGQSGLLFRNRDSGDLAQKLARLMDEPELLQRMGEKALEAYRSRFTGEIFAGNIESVYMKTLNGR